MTRSDHPEIPEDVLPQEFMELLRERYCPEIGVPPEVDAAILAQARQHLESTVTSRRRVGAGSAPGWKRSALLATAATVLVSVVTWRSLYSPGDLLQAPAVSNARSMARNEGHQMTAGRDDVDGDGIVDILDAFALARLVEGGKAVSPDQDRDADGAVSRSDVDVLAGHVVML